MLECNSCLSVRLSVKLTASCWIFFYTVCPFYFFGFWPLDRFLFLFPGSRDQHKRKCNQKPGPADVFRRCSTMQWRPEARRRKCVLLNTQTKESQTPVFEGVCVCVWDAAEVKALWRRRLQPKSMVQLSTSVGLLGGLFGKRLSHVFVCLSA